MSETPQEPQATSAKTSNKVPVQMSDGRTVEFSPNTKVQKELLIVAGSPEDNPEYEGVRFDFANGETRTVMLVEVQPLISRLAVHGLSQKLGDEYAGEKTTDDCLTVFDDLLTTLKSGKFSVGRQSNGLSGSGLLVRACSEAFNVPIAQAMATIKNLSAKEKTVLKESPDVKRIITRLESERIENAKKGVDEAALIGLFTAQGVVAAPA